MKHAVRLPLRLRTIVNERGPDEIRPTIRCPPQGKSIDALVCTSCARMRFIEWDPERGGTIECRTEAEPSPRPVDARADLAEAAARKTLYDAASPVTVCVASGTSVKRVRALLLARKLRAVPVVDVELHVIGIVSQADLLTAPVDATVDDVTPPIVHALPEHAPIAYAIALMAFQRLHEVPVVNDEGELVGMWDANGALRWTAARLGYVDQ